MSAYASLLWAVLLAVEGPAPATSAQESTGEVAEEPPGGAGVSPIELIPRIELRHSFAKLDNGVSVSDTTAEIDIQFVNRLLLRYETPMRIVRTPAGQFSGLGDLSITALGIIASDPRYVVGAIVGGVLNTATQAQLGAGKDQIFFGGGAAFKPRRWLLTYAILQQQLSVGGDDARPDVNQFLARLGGIVFGRQFNWVKVDLDTTVDLESGSGRLFGTLEVGSLLIARVALFARTGTQLIGQRQVDYSLAGGIRYLFRLERGKPRGTNRGSLE